MAEIEIEEGRSSRRSERYEASALRERIDTVLQRTILGLVLVALVWSPLAMGSVRMLDFLVTQGAVTLCLGLWAVRFWTQRPFRLFWPPICWVVYAFVVYALARWRFVDFPFAAKAELFQVIDYGALFVVIINNLNRRESTEAVTVTLLILGAALSMFAAYQYFTDSPQLTFYEWAGRARQYLTRGSGTFVNPDNFAGYVEMLAPLGLAYVLLSRMSAVSKALIAYAVMVILAGVCVSLSRGAMAATAIGLVGVCGALVFEGRRFIPALVALVVIVVAAAVVRTKFEDAQRRFDTVDSHDATLGLRRYYWDVGWKIFHEHEVFGAGPGQFDTQALMRRPEALQQRQTYAHNDYLNTLADWGVVGLSIIVTFAGALFYGAWRSWGSIRRTAGDIGRRQSDKAAFVIGATFGLVALMAHSAVDFDLHIPAVAVLAITLMALVTAQLRFVSERYWKNPGGVGKGMLAMACAAGFYFLLTSTVAQARQQWWLEEGREHSRRLMHPPLDTPEDAKERLTAYAAEIAAWERAAALDPTDPTPCRLLGAQYWQKARIGDQGYQIDTLKAMQWYVGVMSACPVEAYAYVHYASCLDWLGRTKESEWYYEKARQLDPNGWYIKFCYAKHQMEIGNLDEAYHQFIQAGLLSGWHEDEVDYVHMVERRLAEKRAKK